MRPAPAFMIKPNYKTASYMKMNKGIAEAKAPTVPTSLFIKFMIPSEHRSPAV